MRAIPFRLLPLLAFLLGAISVFAFAPFGWWPLQIVTLGCVFHLALHVDSIKRNTLLGLAYGTGWLLAGTSWLYISMHDFGGMPAPLAMLAVILLACGLGLLPALAMGLGTWIRQRRHLSDATMLLLVFPALWALTEWIRGWIFTGFPWVSTGYAHNTGPLAGFAPLIGVYGLGLLAAILAGSVALAPRKRSALVVAIFVILAGIGLRPLQWTRPHGNPISVRLLQGNVPQEMKFAPEQINASLALYRDMIRAAPADLIATPETALPLLSNEIPPGYVADLAGFIRQSQSHLLLGLPFSDGPMQYANSVIGFTPSGPQPYRYDKHHLVPFGEFIPTGFRWFVDMMNMPLGDFTRGKLLQAPFAVKDQYVMPNICYEDLFGEEIAARLGASRTGKIPETTLLLNVSNIAWFGNSIALPQHLQISQMRSLETGRPMLRATNTGTTAIIDSRGTVIGRLAPYSRDTLAASVQGYEGFTPYVLYGNKPFIILALLMLATAWFSVRWKKRP